VVLSNTRRACHRRSGDLGALSVFAGISIAVLIGFVGLAVDLGRAFVIHGEVQAASDSCALAAAAELNGAPDSALRARSVGRYLANRNTYEFQQSPVVIPLDGVTFSATLNDTSSYRTADQVSGASMRYVRCTASATGVIPSLLGAIGIDALNLTATATASTLPSQTTCTLPMALLGSTRSTTFGLTIGELMEMPKGFVWADLRAVSDNRDLAEFRQRLAQSGDCDAPTQVGRCVSIRETSDPKTLIEEWNSRFGVYKDVGVLTPQTAVPDLTGHAFSAGGSLNAYTSFHAANRTPFTGFIQTFSVPPDVNAQFGAPFRRLGIMAIVDKDGRQCQSGRVPLIGWACVLMASPIRPNAAPPPQVEFIGSADSPTSPCRAAGVPGGPGAVGPLVPGLVQ
jgi:hypothetical protein